MIFRLQKNLAFSNIPKRNVSLKNTIDFRFGADFTPAPNNIKPFSISPPKPTFPNNDKDRHYVVQRIGTVVHTNSSFKFAGTISNYKNISSPVNFSFKPTETAENLNIFAAAWQSSIIGVPHSWNFHSFATTSGIDSQQFGKPGLRNDTSYIKPNGYESVLYGRPTVFNLDKYVYPSAWQSSVVPKPERAINKNRPIRPVGYVATSFGGSLVYNSAFEIKVGGWQSSEVSKSAIIANKNKPLLPQSFVATSMGYPKAHNSDQHIKASGWQSSRLDGAANVFNHYKNIYPQSFTSSSFGSAIAHNKTSVIGAKGWQVSAVGTPEQVVNYNKTLLPSSFRSSQAGTPLVYNLTQYRYLNGFDASSYGVAYLMGGVKYLTPQGYDASGFGKAGLINTTADQTAKPTGINSLVMPAPSVSPRMLYPTGIASPVLGRPDVRDPAIKPMGELHTSYGTPTVWFHTRPLSPNGILSYQSGYPRVADPTQFAYPPSLLTSAIFGDTAIRNLSFKVSVPAIFDGGFSDYTTLTNSNRYYKPSGINSLVIGAASITNKTPSIFVDGINPYDVGTPAIGHAIRTVVPTGFDHLLFGRAVLTKTPELKTIGHQSSVVGQAWISHKNRTIDLIQKGISSFKAGEPTVWYGQRPVKTLGWQTASYGNPTLTHEVRQVLGQGFKRDAYGMPWVSFGTRRLEPVGIYKDFPSNHMVGGTQTIKPAGYEATLWGERIIPESQSIQPLGFSGLWGTATVDLHTKYIAPVGYISVGHQPADRWGDITVYNKLQYIVQEFDVNSGLVPPKWSDWTAIANRNIQMNVTGFANQRFGYSQIDNNATPLLPNGIEPPAITIGMISHGVRAVTPEAIEAPPISTWGVVHNGARVIAPLGHTHTQWGNDGTVVNTRREYRNVGRIDSLETGTPMIAYRIRTIDIEPRYSIAPPQINLPTIDLYTRYVGFNGYETVKYGLPSLSIHFNIIGPSWRYRDDFGESVVRNVTPELQAGAFDSQEFGRASIRTQWRHVQAQGDTATLFGSAMIADTKQQIGLRGWQDSIISQLHTVTKTGTPPYTTQNIWLQNESNPSADGFGIEPTSKPSEPGLNQNVLYARGFIATKFGEAVVSSNNLYIEIGISTVNIPVNSATIVENRVRAISPEGIDNTIRITDEHMVTPFYIKPSSFNHPGDYSSFSQGDKFGHPRVDNRHRQIYPRGHQSSNVGYNARVELHTRYIIPPTIRGFAMGFPEIPFTPKTIDIKDYGFNSEQHGRASIDYPPYIGPQTIGAKGLNSFNTGTSRVELLHRNITASGRDSLAMGRSISNDTPYMWQGLRVGEFVPMSIGAGDTSLFGDTAIGLRVREIPVEGFVAFRSEYEPARFKDRMKVIGSLTNNPLTQGVTAVGIGSEAMGNPSIKPAQHFIRPDGNSDQFRKGAF